MARAAIIAIFIASLVSSSIQRSTPEDDSYVAAVLEYQTASNSALGLQLYVAFIQEAALQNADIVAFPEMTFIRGSEYMTVPIHDDLQSYPIPAIDSDLYEDALVAISRAARENQIYVVINVQERMDCTYGNTTENCPEQKVYFFNTNVVFDRNGAVIDRFRKINLFGEASRTPALTPDLGVFDTDFGVRFGHYICFDLKFQVPALQVVQKYNITDVIFTTMWFSEMPYLTAVQIQEGYSYTLDVNFIASGANNVRVGSAGSGIYSGKAGALVSTMPGVPTTRLLVARVPKIPGLLTETYEGPTYNTPTEQDGLYLISDPSFPSHLTRELTPGSQEFTLEYNDTVCKFTVTMNERGGETQYKYRAAAFSGVRSYSGVATGGVRICSVVACSGDTIDTCARRFPEYTEDSTAVFEELTIVATMPTPRYEPELEADDSVVYPLSLDVHIMPLKPAEFFYNVNEEGDITTHTLTLNKHDAELYSFAVWGRFYEPDGQEPTPPLEEDPVVEATPNPDDDEEANTPAPGSSVTNVINKIVFPSMFAAVKWVSYRFS